MPEQALQFFFSKDFRKLALYLMRGKREAHFLFAQYKGEGRNEFIARCMASEAMQKEFPEEGQRAAVADNT
jgi:hypothetical protein